MTRACRTALSALLSILSVAGLLGWSSTAAAEPKVPDNVIVERDVEYARVGDRVLRLDVVRPKQDSDHPRPVMAYIHGGGWRGGNKADAIGSLIALASQRDLVCFTIGYRFTNEAIWPAQIYDCKAAIRWIKAQAKKYNLDPEKIAVMGHSAGGHLVSLLGTTGGVKELEGDEGNLEQSSRVTCVIDYFGPTDFLTIGRDNPTPAVALGPKSLVGYLLGGAVEDKKDVAKAASPITYVTPDDPPFLILHGTKDPLVPYAQAEDFAKALREAKVPVTLVKIEGGGHGFGGKEIDRRVQAFLEKYLLGRDVPISDTPIPVR